MADHDDKLLGVGDHSAREDAHAEIVQKQKQDKRMDYFNTFYATEHGRRVLFDLYHHIQTRFPDGAEYALANQALQEMYLLIQLNAGLSEEDVIAASAALLETEGD